jgi:hypothetical protein
MNAFFVCPEQELSDMMLLVERMVRPRPTRQGFQHLPALADVGAMLFSFISSHVCVSLCVSS